jgi:6-pyruvoyltetrahydropterin/6-carboxytetrahydropterin synthase
MNFELKTQFRIESARFLPNLPEGHPCKRMHGHGFVIVLKLVGGLDPKIGWVRDYHEIEKTARIVLDLIDHRVLNEVPGLENPTSELLCKWLFEKLKPLIVELKRVSVLETPTTECSYPAE